jgi:hypothetical protein
VLPLRSSIRNDLLVGVVSGESALAQASGHGQGSLLTVEASLVRLAIMRLVPPIFIDNEVDGLSNYVTVEALEDHLEPWYATDEQFRAYDSDGRMVELVLEQRTVPGSFGVRARRVEVVTARSCEDDPQHADELSAALTDFLARRGAAGATDAMTLSDLVAKVVSLPGD